MAKRSMFVGMDVHKESIDISLAEEGRDGEVRHYGVILRNGIRTLLRGNGDAKRENHQHT